MLLDGNGGWYPCGDAIQVFVGLLRLGQVTMGMHGGRRVGFDDMEQRDAGAQRHGEAHRLGERFAEAQRADPPAAVRAEMEALLHDYLTYLLERKLNSPEFLAEVRQQHKP